MIAPHRFAACAVLFAALLFAVRAHAQETPPSDVPKVDNPPSLDTPKAENPPAEHQMAEPTQKGPPAPEEAAISGFKKGKGFKLVSPDSQWSLRVGMQAAPRIQILHSTDEGWQPTGQFYVVRPRIDGTLFKDWIRFWTSFEFASNPPFLLDSYIEAQPMKEFAIRLGQFWSPVSWHEQLGPQELVFPDWAYVSEYYWPGRDKGIAVFGTVADGHFAYQAQLTGGTGLRTFQTVPGNWLAQAAARFYPMGAISDTTEFAYMMTENGGALPTRVGISVSGWAGKLESQDANFNPRRGQLKFTPSGEGSRQQGGEADVLVQAGNLIFYAEGTLKRTDPFGAGGSDSSLSMGAWGQISAAVVPKYVDVALQGGWIDPDTRSSASSDSFIYGEAQVGYYIAAPYLFVRLRYGIAHQDTPATAEPALAGPPGWSHIATLQWNVYF